ncbi:MAG: phage terminase small subunit P27 family [Bacteroidia bacterium]|jgi:P27 family predicted phage terminase small subunit
MATRGKPKKPRKVKEAQGTLRKHRDKPELELPAVSVVPLAPDKLNEYGKQEWSNQIFGLVESGIFAQCDKTIFEMYCGQIGLYRQLVDEYTKEGMMKGKMINPKVYLANSVLKQAVAIGAKFGLTPADRPYITPPKDKAKSDPIEAMLQQLHGKR